MLESVEAMSFLFIRGNEKLTFLDGQLSITLEKKINNCTLVTVVI